MTFQLVPPDDHFRNLAEKEIQAWKDHSIDIISGMTAAFPFHLWFQSISQTDRQILLLIKPNVNPKVCSKGIPDVGGDLLH